MVVRVVMEVIAVVDMIMDTVVVIKSKSSKVGFLDIFLHH